MTKQEKIDIIISNIATKKIIRMFVLICPECWHRTNSRLIDMNTGKRMCKCKKCDRHTYNKERIIYKYEKVMIWDILYWIENSFNKKENSLEELFNVHENNKKLQDVISLRTKKRESIKCQSYECIDFIYSFIE